jgi:glutaminase
VSPNIVWALADFPLFKGVNQELISLVEAEMHTQAFNAGEAILVSGQAGDGRIFFIESGNVSILVPIAGGNHQRIASLGAGMNFGEMVLLGQTTRSASVFADNDVKCRILGSDALETLANRTPLLKILLLENLAKDMASNLRRATQWIAALA